MATVKLVAKERFYYNGRNREKDEEFDALEQDVAILTFSHTPKATVPVVIPLDRKADDELGRTEKPDSESQGTRQKAAPRYVRRDMKAED